jgi:hypothetical protein
VGTLIKGLGDSTKFVGSLNAVGVLQIIRVRPKNIPQIINVLCPDGGRKGGNGVIWRGEGFADFDCASAQWYANNAGSQSTESSGARVENRKSCH